MLFHWARVIRWARAGDEMRADSPASRLREQSRGWVIFIVLIGVVGADDYLVLDGCCIRGWVAIANLLGWFSAVEIGVS